jgi:hypothetical protein
MKLFMRAFAAGLGCLLSAAVPAQLANDAYMTNLSITGNVIVENGRTNRQGLDAHTRFELGANVSWTFESGFVKKGNDFELVLTPSITKAEIAVRHYLLVPPGKEHDPTLYQTLMLHEYDHVAISCDGRARALLHGLLKGMGPIRQLWTGAIPAPNDALHALIRTEVDARKAAVIRLMQDAYERLDALTDHGRQPIRNRREFFGGLYTLEHMQAAKFPYLEEARRVLQTPAYTGAKRYYRF